MGRVGLRSQDRMHTQREVSVRNTRKEMAGSGSVNNTRKKWGITIVSRPSQANKTQKHGARVHIFAASGSPQASGSGWDADGKRMGSE